MKLSTGNTITWRSAAGDLTGSITSIDIALNAAKQLVPWITVTTNTIAARLCATDASIKMLQIQLVD